MANFALSTEEIEAIAERVAALLRPSLTPVVVAGDGSRLLFSEEEAAAALSISPVTLKTWRHRGDVQAHTRKKPIVYRHEDIERIAAWMATRE